MKEYSSPVSHYHNRKLIYFRILLIPKKYLNCQRKLVASNTQQNSRSINISFNYSAQKIVFQFNSYYYSTWMPKHQILWVLSHNSWDVPKRIKTYCFRISVCTQQQAIEKTAVSNDYSECVVHFGCSDHNDLLVFNNFGSIKHTAINWAVRTTLKIAFEAVLNSTSFPTIQIHGLRKWSPDQPQQLSSKTWLSTFDIECYALCCCPRLGQCE